jgi:hypothetical protein
MMAADLSRRLGWLTDDDVERVKLIHERAGLPVVGPALGADRYLELMAHDKKVSDGTLRLVLLKGIGRAVISSEASPAQMRASIEACCADPVDQAMTHWRPTPSREANSRGRQLAEPPPLARGEFQRDRDRIVHCTAFRRLEYKTQVFVNHEGDLFRTRLTHSIEVAQITRSIARALHLNEDLAEAVALSHDLGHTPSATPGRRR